MTLVTRLITIFVGSLIASVAAPKVYAQSSPPVTVTPTGGTASRALQDKLGDTLSIRDFGAACDGSTDDSMVLSNAVTALRGTDRTILVPANCRLLLGPAARMAGKTPVLDTVNLAGEGGRDSGTTPTTTFPTGYGLRGSTILLTDTVGPSLIVTKNVSIRHLVFFWPGVSEATTPSNGAPPVYPALISGPGSVPGGTAGETSSLRFEDNDVINATVVIDVHADISGALFISDNRAFFTSIFLNLAAIIHRVVGDLLLCDDGSTGSCGLIGRRRPQWGPLGSLNVW